jgi:hypothetical protein
MAPRLYGLTTDLKTRDEGEVTADQAIRRAREIFGALRSHYEDAGEALAATTFGLSASDKYFVEFCVHGVNHISARFEGPGLPWYHRLVRGSNANHRTLRSLNEVEGVIQRFFVERPEAFVRAMVRAEPSN